MKAQHISPVEAVEIHKDVRSEMTIGVHWGTYQMGAYEVISFSFCLTRSIGIYGAEAVAGQTDARGEEEGPFQDIPDTDGG